MCEAAPFQRGSVSGKCWPMSPSPIAPSSASVRACRATSASEWPCKRVRVGDADAAQPDVVAGDETVHVEALAGAHVGHRRAGLSAMARSSAVVSLRLAALPVHQRHRQPGPFRDRGIVGHVVLAGGQRALVGGQDLGEAEALRGLRPPQPGAIEGGGDAVAGRRPA